MPFAGLGGSTVPVAVTERADAARHQGATAPTAAPSTRRSPAALLDDPADKRLRTDGTPLPGVEIRLDDEGEISSRGPDCCVGYTDPALTAAVFDADGWYRTGDVGVLDDDGYLTITDRVSDIIIRGGENISAQEIEELLLGIDAVAEVARGGRARRAPRRARRRRRPRSATAPTAPTLEDVRAHLAAAGLAKQKWPESIYVVADFPRTAVRQGPEVPAAPAAPRRRAAGR